MFSVQVGDRRGAPSGAMYIGAFIMDTSIATAPHENTDLQPFTTRTYLSDLRHRLLFTSTFRHVEESSANSASLLLGMGNPYDGFQHRIPVPYLGIQKLLYRKRRFCIKCRRRFCRSHEHPETDDGCSSDRPATKLLPYPGLWLLRVQFVALRRRSEWTSLYPIGPLLRPIFRQCPLAVAYSCNLTLRRLSCHACEIQRIRSSLETP